MPTEVIMPALGMAQDTGKLISWIRQEGEEVSKGDPLFEVETDKVTVEVEAATSGILVALSAQAGEDVPVGQVIAYLIKAGEPIPEIPNSQPDAQLSEPPVEDAVTASNGVDTLSQRIAVSPVAQRIADLHNVDLTLIDVGGRRIMKADVLDFLEAPQSIVTTQPETVANPSAVSTPLDTKWNNTPHITLRRNIVVDAALNWAEVTGMSFVDVLLKACAAALAQHQQANAYWSDGQIFIYDHINLGYIVSEAGSIVIENADQLSPAMLAHLRQEREQQFHTGMWNPQDFPHSTFTVSHLDAVDNFNAVLTAPQAAYLASGRITEQAHPTGEGPVVQAIVTLSLTTDHRILDGARTAELLNQIVDYLQEPLLLLDTV